MTLTPEDQDHEGLRVSRSPAERVATLWLDRPAKRNSVTRAMWAALPGVLAPLADDPGVRVLVVRGANGTFSAGADISEVRERHIPGPDGLTYSDVNHAAEEALTHFPKPTIAVVEGPCVGGGCSIAVACDLRIADTSARFGITPARLGIVYPTHALERVTHLLGPASAKWLLYSGELVDSDWALRTGLVNAVHAPEELDEAVTALCATLTQRSLLTQQATKEMINAIAYDGVVSPDLAGRWIKEAQSGPDVAEGVAAFLERRTPRFTWPARDQ